jgi:flagella basal body P-ring formation protein FlgA
MRTVSALVMLVPVLMWAGSSCVTVEGERILAGDLARVAPGFAGADASAVLGYAPAPGSRRLISGAELQRMAKRLGVTAGFPAEICVEQAVAPLTREQVESALSTALAGTDAGLVLADFSKLPVPHGALEFARSGLLAPRGGAADQTVVWRGKVVYSGGRSVNVWARVRLAATRQRVVAAANLPAGRLIPASGLRVEEAEEFPFGQASIRELNRVVGMVPRRTIREGEPVREWLLTIPREVSRGEEVEVRVESGEARLSFIAKAETGGRAGDHVLVKNPENGQRFAARVESKGKVTVLAGGGTREK